MTLPELCSQTLDGDKVCLLGPRVAEAMAT